MPDIEQVLFCTILGVRFAAWKPGNPCQLPAKKHCSSQAASCECMWAKRKGGSGRGGEEVSLQTPRL